MKGRNAFKTNSQSARTQERHSSWASMESMWRSSTDDLAGPADRAASHSKAPEGQREHPQSQGLAPLALVSPQAMVAQASTVRRAHWCAREVRGVSVQS